MRRPSGPPWRELTKGRDGTRFYYDPGRLKRLEQQRVQLWIKSVSPGQSTMAQWELDCSAEKFRLLSQTTYDRMGSGVPLAAANGAWGPVVPESVNEAIYRFVCARG